MEGQVFLVEGSLKVDQRDNGVFGIKVLTTVKDEAHKVKDVGFGHNDPVVRVVDIGGGVDDRLGPAVIQLVRLEHFAEQDGCDARLSEN